MSFFYAIRCRSASPSALASVVLTSMSPCGCYIAVVTSTQTKDTHSRYHLSKPFSELIVWQLQKVDGLLIEENHPNEFSLLPQWHCIGRANLFEIAISPRSPPSASLLLSPPDIADHAHIDWNDRGSLIVVTPVKLTEDPDAKLSQHVRFESLSRQDDVASILSEGSLISQEIDLLVSLVPLPQIPYSLFGASEVQYTDTPNDLSEILRTNGKIVQVNLSFDIAEGPYTIDGIACFQAFAVRNSAVGDRDSLPLSTPPQRRSTRIAIWGGSNIFVLILHQWQQATGIGFDCRIEWAEV